MAAFKREMNLTGVARVMTRDEADWPYIGLTFNLARTKKPGLIVYVGNVDTIRRALTFAKKFNIRVSLISSGHSFPGRCTAEGSMQISVHFMKGIEVAMNCTEHALGCMNVQAGVQWGEAYREANKYNRLVVGGSNPTVSVTGWSLGGGHSPMSRMFGLGADNTLAFHLVTADLSEVWTSASGTKINRLNGTEIETKDTSLFWALRGGGSAFGVIVDITIKMYKDNKIAQMVCSYPAYTDGTGKTFKVMYDSLGPLLTTAPNTFSGYILPSVGCDQKSRQCGGTSVVSVIHYGPANDPQDAGWIKNFTDLPHTWTAAGLTNGGCQLNEYESFYKYELSIPNSTYTTLYLAGSLIQQDLLTDSFTDTLIRHLDIAYARAKKDLAYNFLGTAIWVGGAVQDKAIDSVPVHPGWRNAIFTFSLATAWDIRTVKVPPALQIQGVKDLSSDLSRFSNGKYYNEADLDMPPAEWKKQFWSTEAYKKLMNIKKAWDPKNMFTCVDCLGSDWDPTEKDSVVG